MLEYKSNHANGILLMLHSAINETEKFQAEVADDKELNEEIGILSKRLDAALSILDGTRHARYSKSQKRSYVTNKNRKPKLTLLCDHHNEILKSNAYGEEQGALAERLGVSRQTLYNYKKKHGIAKATKAELKKIVSK